MKKTTVLIIDNHEMIKPLFTAIIAKNKNITLLCHTNRMDEAAVIIREQKPDIVLLDTNTAPFFGLDEVTMIRQLSPATKTIAVSITNDTSVVEKMMYAGINGYLTTASSRQDIDASIETVMAGNVFICSQIKKDLANPPQAPGTETVRYEVPAWSLNFISKKRGAISFG
jgi:Response regulator containing a CheY-like receiver domain and an HTH DNA-binding domain